MKTKAKHIPHPDFISAKKLTPLQLNEMRWDNKHTLLTPEVLEAIASKKKNNY